MEQDSEHGIRCDNNNEIEKRRKNNTNRNNNDDFLIQKKTSYFCNKHDDEIKKDSNKNTIKYKTERTKHK